MDGRVVPYTGPSMRCPVPRSSMATTDTKATLEYRSERYATRWGTSARVYVHGTAPTAPQVIHGLSDVGLRFEYE